MDFENRRHILRQQSETKCSNTYQQSLIGMIIYVLTKRTYMWHAWFNVCILIFVNHVPYVTRWCLRIKELWWSMVIFLCLLFVVYSLVMYVHVRGHDWQKIIKDVLIHIWKGIILVYWCKYLGYLGSLYLDACINLLNKNPCKKYSSHLGVIIPRCL